MRVTKKTKKSTARRRVRKNHQRNPRLVLREGLALISRLQGQFRELLSEIRMAREVGNSAINEE
jgi:hypothetical protein